MNSQKYQCSNCDSIDSLVIEEEIETIKIFQVSEIDKTKGSFVKGDFVSEEVTRSVSDVFCKECNYYYFDLNEILLVGEEPKDTRRKEIFSSPEAASAFCMGIEYANDSALSVSGPYEEKHGVWAVYITDLDEVEDDE